MSSTTAAFTLHWGGEKGGTIRQICKKGGKIVFSQENTGRKGACASCPDQSGFRDYEDGPVVGGDGGSLFLSQQAAPRAPPRPSGPRGRRETGPDPSRATQRPPGLALCAFATSNSTWQGGSPGAPVAAAARLSPYNQTGTKSQRKPVGRGL